MQKEKVLIIGINSFLGKAIFNYIRDEFEVSAVYHKNQENIPQGIELVQANDIGQLKGRLFSHIYLVSSYVPANNKDVDDQQLIEANIQLPKTICNLFPSARVLFCSSVSVYERSIWDKIISVSETIPAPQSRYAISKLWGEQIIANHSSYAIIRISSMYGVGMKPTTFIPRIIDSAFSTGEINLLGDGKRLQNYVHVNDVAKIAVSAVKFNENLVIHAVGDQSYSNKQIAEKISTIIPSRVTYNGMDNTPSYKYDNSQTTAKLGSLNYTTIDEGLNELIEWNKRKF